MVSKEELKERFSTGNRPTGSDFSYLIDGATKHREVFVSTENQKVFVLQNIYNQFKNHIEVIVGGSQQFSPENFTETSTTSITLAEGLPAGIDVVISYVG